MKLVKLRGELGSRFVPVDPSDSQISYVISFLERGQVAVDDTFLDEFDSGFFWQSQPVFGSSNIRIRSGTVGFLLIVSDLALASTLRDCNESATLSRWIREQTNQQLTPYPRLIQDLQFYFNSLADEQAHHYPAAESLSQAWLLSLLLSVWRTLHPMPRTVDSVVPHAERRIVRFRSLLELHYRERWKVDDYARALSVTADNLHEICRRHLDKPPSQLIQERTLNAAIQLLTESDDSINQISDALGFQSTAHFCTYFRKAMEQTPRKFRLLARQSEERAAGFSDWP